MCGRYKLAEDFAEIAIQLRIEAFFGEVTRSDDVRPTNPVPIVRLEDGKRTGRIVKWGLIPSWAKDPKIASHCMNARAEGIEAKPAFRAAVRSRRCVVPADAFYEWPVVAGKKLKHLITPTDGRILAFAGVWESWRDPTGASVETTTIITCGPNHEMAQIHDRMPVILAHRDLTPWLDPATPLPAALALLRPPPDGTLHAAPC